ncbi:MULTISPECIES: hypothetical protein [unclassified Streptomyces]|uniref:hypothetical protein n=1 Tax=unclassified Streptomyces TaxID=2593676 RepID=UPI00093C91BA|nr:hypothetical protein [Streptomyces sp. TSRI0107]OKJ90677.1 hypothetical protein AMK31_02850 [Streptomyces sp. TSRI0107]
MDSAIGAGRAEDWVALDVSVWSGTVGTVMGWKYHGRIRVGFQWFDDRDPPSPRSLCASLRPCCRSC